MRAFYYNLFLISFVNNDKIIFEHLQILIIQ